MGKKTTVRILRRDRMLNNRRFIIWLENPDSKSGGPHFLFLKLRRQPIMEWADLTTVAVIYNRQW